jgi:hypothetical protein
LQPEFYTLSRGLTKNDRGDDADGDAWLVLGSAYVHGWVGTPRLGVGGAPLEAKRRSGAAPRRGLLRYLLLVEQLVS